MKVTIKQVFQGHSQVQKKHLCVKNMPYFAQWESRKLVDDIVHNRISALADPLWKNSGAENPAEYLHWSWNGCGMACLKMILAYKTKKVIPLVELGKKCVGYGGYKINQKEWNKDNFSESIDGLFYKPFVEFIKKEFNLDAKIVSPLLVSEIIDGLDNGKFVIVSVSPSIRNYGKKPIKRGGHLVFVVGFDLNKKLIFIHNPSGVSKKSQEYYPVPLRDFKRFFACRGVIIS